MSEVTVEARGERNNDRSYGHRYEIVMEAAMSEKSHEMGKHTCLI